MIWTNGARTYIAWTKVTMPVGITPRSSQKKSLGRTSLSYSQWQANIWTHPGTNDRTNERTNDRNTDRNIDMTNDRASKRNNDRNTVRTNDRIDDWTNDQSKITHCNGRNKLMTRNIQRHKFWQNVHCKLLGGGYKTYFLISCLAPALVSKHCAVFSYRLI